MANVKFTGLPTSSGALVAGDLIAVTQNVSSTPVSRSALVSQVIDNTAYTSAWSGITTVAPSKNAIYTQLHKIDTADDGTIISAGTGFRIAGAAVSGKILIGDGTNFVASTPTFPNASATARKFIVSDGTNWVASTETQAIPGTAGNILVSDGTNWISVARPEYYYNGSGTGLASSFASNIQVPGSVITIQTAGGWKQNGGYRCAFDMVKSAAGAVAYVINVHMGTLGTTGDAIVATLTAGSAGTAAADGGLFEVYLTFKSVGGGTSAVITAYHRLTKIGTTTGIINNGTNIYHLGGTSAGFNSTTQTKISIGFNGGASFSGSNSWAQAEYRQ